MNQRFTVSDLADPRLTRQFNSIAQLAEEQSEVRISGGIHFRNSLVVSGQMGRKSRRGERSPDRQPAP
jgi:hypothetical protein